MKKRKILSLFLGLCLLISLLPTVALAADQTNDGAGIRIQYVDGSYDKTTGIMKVRVQAKMPAGTGITCIGILMSWDNAKLSLVSQYDSTYDYAPADDKSEDPASDAMNTIMATKKKSGPPVPGSYTVTDGKVYTKDARTALYTFHANTDPLTYVGTDAQTSGNWFDVYEVMFRVAGKPNDPATVLNSDSLRIADADKGDGAVMKGAFPANNIYSIYLTDNSDPAKLYVLNRMSECTETEVTGEKSLMTAPETGTATYPGSTNSPSATTKTLDSIAVTTAPTKTVYNAGEDFDETGMVVTANYSDSSTAAVTTYTVTDGNSLTAGKTSVTISYTEGSVTKTCTQDITVNAATKTLDSIAVTTAPTKTTYTAGENFNPAGMVVTATYSDTSTAAVTSYTVTDGNSLTAGKTSVTISYTEGSVTQTCTQAITVNAATKTLDSIAVTTAPTKTTYTAGENFNPAGMVVTATYSDTSTAAVTSYTVTDGNSLTAGTTSVTISYTEGSVTKTCTQAITVNAATKTLDSIAVTTPPTKTTYTAGENFDPADMVVTATYNDGSTAAVTTYTVTDGNSLTAGKTSVTISYTEGSVTKTCTQGITVNAAPPVPVTLTGITVKTGPDKVTYTEGESFDKTGMVIEATYSDSTKKDVTTYTYAPTGALTTANTTISISYTEGSVTKTCTQSITVNAVTPPAPATLTGISVKTAPDKVTYTEGESFDKTGMVIEATYSDSTKKDVTTYTYTPTGALTTSDTTISISYTEGSVTQTCTQAITVNAATKTLDSIAVTTPPTKTTYTAGENFDPAGMVVTATYSDTSTAAVTSYTVTDGNSLTAGKTSVTISYTEGSETKTCTQAITVNAAPPAPTEYTITFNGNGGTPSVGTMSTAGGKLTSLPTATRSGSYSFDGWYTAASGGTQITTAYVFSANTTVYAHWTYTGGGGSYYAPTVPDMPMLYRGCTGDAVKTLQEKLNAKGFDSGNVDGIFGAKTYAAATAFQKANGLGVDGIVGKLTWAKLYDATPVNVTPVTTQPMLRTGSRGDAVRKLQELLNAKGYTCGSVDGIFGSKTYAAVLAFQKANGLAADGIVGSLTWGKLV